MGIAAIPDTMMGQPSAQMAAPRAGDAWPRVITLIAALNPVVLLVVGWFLNSGIEQNRLKLAENSSKLADLKTSAETATIVLGQRVDKVAVIREFLNDLSGPDERRRRLAIEAIVIALPDEAASPNSDDTRDRAAVVREQLRRTGPGPR